MENSIILVADEDPTILKFIRANLMARGFGVVTASDGESALKAMEEVLPDLIILDSMLPGIDGTEVCREIRKWSRVPIIMLSAKNELMNKVELLKLGADDYITKPFGIDELIARTRAVLRRSNHNKRSESSVLCSGDLRLSFVDKKVTVADKEVNLTSTEYDLLRELGLNAGKVLTHPALLTRVWGPDYDKELEYLRVYIGRLRSKIEADPRKPQHILTKPRVGYYFHKQEPEK